MVLCNEREIRTTLPEAEFLGFVRLIIFIDLLIPVMLYSQIW